MKVYGKTRIAMNTATCRKVLERVARSRWGQQGIGKIPNLNHAQILVAVKMVRSVDPEKKIYALTLGGFRFLERIRWDQSVKEAMRPNGIELHPLLEIKAQ